MTPRIEYGNTGRQPCTYPKCSERSLPGLHKGQGLCRYHWNLKLWGKDWADKVAKDEGETPK